MRRLLLSALAATCATSALAQPPRIVADMPATASLIQQVLGDQGQVHVLLPRGASPHHHQLRPSDAGALQEAQLLVWIGPELTPWLDKAAGSMNADATQLRLLRQAGTYLRSYGDGQDEDDGHAHSHDHDHDHDHDHEHEHEHEHEHDDHTTHGDHDHDGTDPHAWLDPANARPWLEAIAAELARHDPENTALYQANADAAAGRIDSLDARIRQDLTPLKGRGFVVFHDAYGYFTEHYGLNAALPLSLGDATAPSAARLQQIRNQIVQTGATCAFPEYGQDARLIDSVIADTDLRIGGDLDPTGHALEPGADLYGQILRGMADRLIDCLSRD